MDKAIEGEIIAKVARENAIRILALAINAVETYTHQYLFQSSNMFSSDGEFVRYVAGLFLFTLKFYLPVK